MITEMSSCAIGCAYCEVAKGMASGVHVQVSTNQDHWCRFGQRLEVKFGKHWCHLSWYQRHAESLRCKNMDAAIRTLSLYYEVSRSHLQPRSLSCGTILQGNISTIMNHISPINSVQNQDRAKRQAYCRQSRGHRKDIIVCLKNTYGPILRPIMQLHLQYWKDSTVSVNVQMSDYPVKMVHALRNDDVDSVTIIGLNQCNTEMRLQLP